MRGGKIAPHQTTKALFSLLGYFETSVKEFHSVAFIFTLHITVYNPQSESKTNMIT
ncbi:hypothetical protein ACJX0J_012357, partial [Zea mays]